MKEGIARYRKASQDETIAKERKGEKRKRNFKVEERRGKERRGKNGSLVYDIKKAQLIKRRTEKMTI